MTVVQLNIRVSTVKKLQPIPHSTTLFYSYLNRQLSAFSTGCSLALSPVPLPSCSHLHHIITTQPHTLQLWPLSHPQIANTLPTHIVKLYHQHIHCTQSQVLQLGHTALYQYFDPSIPDLILFYFPSYILSLRHSRLSHLAAFSSFIDFQFRKFLPTCLSPYLESVQ